VYEEIKEGDDNLAEWVKNDQNKEALLFEEYVDVSLVSRVTDEGYANSLSDDEVEKIGRDPFLVAYALADNGNRCIVTTEASKPSRQRANRHLPDVCDTFGVPWVNTFQFTRALNFSTRWKDS
jgi:hypothetical protein